MSTSALEFLDYPCRYPLKVVGKKDDQFESAVTAIIRQILPSNCPLEISYHPSKKNTYLSITFTFEALSKDQLKKIYHALYDCPQVMMTL